MGSGRKGLGLKRCRCVAIRHSHGHAPRSHGNVRPIAIAIIHPVPVWLSMQRITRVLSECRLGGVRRSILTIQIRIGGITIARAWVGGRDPVVNKQGVHGPLGGREYGAAGRWDAAPRRSVW